MRERGGERKKREGEKGRERERKGGRKKKGAMERKDERERKGEKEKENERERKGRKGRGIGYDLGEGHDPVLLSSDSYSPSEAVISARARKAVAAWARISATYVRARARRI